jgi:hypothetical protein
VGTLGVVQQPEPSPPTQHIAAYTGKELNKITMKISAGQSLRNCQNLQSGNKLFLRMCPSIY